MKISKEQLNQVAELLGTTDKNVAISAVIKTLVDAGMSVKEAFESTFGEGSYAKMAEEIYDSLNA